MRQVARHLKVYCAVVSQFQQAIDADRLFPQ
jgi:hypothetical protein